tara:strand:+ start:208 stop:663 length:456 start_codon:yes stop_codon:yes gene_type:complete
METKPAPDHLTDYRMVKLSDGTLLVGSVVVEGEFLRIENPLELTTVQRMTEFGMKDDSSLAPWIPFTIDTSMNIPKDKIMVIAKAAKELAHYYEVVLRKVKTQVKQKPLSPEEMEHIMQVAEEMDRQTQDEKIKEVSEMFGGYEIKSKKVH